MAVEDITPRILTKRELNAITDMYHDDLPVVVQVGPDQFLGVLFATTTVLKPGNVLALNLTAIKTPDWQKTEPVVVQK